ncbi:MULTISPECIES: cob(I)yrinic acid a,c-diamide adenosyltransferase [Enterobacter]|jgi:cob(I)alamin adenosyltransferase|uniref:Corrinoid adenosyltransferase n=1 Tax=Enterobacter pseudoroggenkampii TaxID=2996112 RepID=A0ABT3XAW7_9ENTR|nr:MULTISPECIES: cob(I)yrinic acid a,c-diamide adenosyltransferase [Enterobacter]MCK4227503.1 cob(I)yrinic acid a,c-diamide adenosyltransferase [Enterobacter asburiae]EWG68697.1 Cob(I)yrinic acid a,c-diamide adenosyltransferase [Enterobacter sp. DC3]EWG77646.1 Cob(I)yrinic acid a,c-diamide adenosyltransferase [Enterobacter sp. DC4]KAE8275468.1 cob(I)yrinic acid a,c-diamide adenosyltransferase [Enterobacter sp. C6]MCX8288548.1 cob(I)yrinic acid a,c-diamide adenosyltransferase [Enterobacter pseu
MEARANAEKHRQRQQKRKEQVDIRVAAATEKKGILIVFTGNGKGKSTAAFGTATRAVGHGKTVGVAQFIKGQWDNGEYNTLHPLGVEFHIMGTGFTWETQNRETDIQAAAAVWQESKRMLADPSYDLVVLDELTYMLAYHYLDTQEVIAAVENRPVQQTVIVTGRGCHSQLLALADTVSEMRPVKHAFDSGIQAQEGIDW